MPLVHRVQRESMKRARRADDLSFLAGGGEMGALMRAYDWSQTSLGSPETWPQSLRSAVSILLPSKAQICLFWGPDYISIYNDSYRPALGMKHPWALGKPASEMWKEFWEDVLRPLLDNVVNTGDAFYGNDYPFALERLGFPEETYFDISYDPVRDESGKVGGVFCIVSETTGRVIGERRLGVLRDVNRVASEAQTTADAFGRVAEILKADQIDVPFACLYETGGNGAGPQFVVGFGPEALTRVDWPFAEAAATRKEVILQGEALSGLPPLPGGAWPEPAKAVVTLPLIGPGQEPLGYLVAGTSPRRPLDALYLDFLRLLSSNAASAVGTARALAQERARAHALAELDRAKTLFFSNVSHEFRTPLTLMLGPVGDLLEQGDELAPGIQSQIRMVQRNSLRLLKLVNTMLDFSRIEAGRARASYQPTDVAAVTIDLASQFRSACERAGLKLSIDCPPVGEPVFVDRDLWEKIVLNLLSNAFKFTFEGGISVRMQRRGNAVELEVSDTGIGIAEDQLPKVFDRFHRVEGARGRSFEGTGIGLALVQELVKLHGGAIAVESTIGSGTTFRIRVPLGFAHLPKDRIAPEAAATSASGRTQAYIEEALSWLPAGNGKTGEQRTGDEVAEPISGETGAGRRVLVVDDNADMRNYLARLLSAQQYAVELAEDGEAALRSATESKPDAILSDIMMPKMDGFEVLRRLRADETTRDIPVILLSARAGEESKVEGLEAGADDYLVKPFSARELFARTASVIALRESRRKIAQAAREENERIRRLFDQAPGFIAILRDADHKFEFVNRAYDDIAGGREVIGKTVREAFPEIEGQGFFELLDGVYRTGERFVGTAMPVRLARGTGGSLDLRYVDFVYEPVVGETGKPVGIFLQGYDVTDRVEAESALRESEERFRTLADNISTLCWMAGPDGNIFWYNSRWYQYTGTTPNEQEGWGWQSVHDPEILPVVLEKWRHSIATGEPFEMTFPLRGADGVFRPFLTRILPMKDAQGKVVRWFGTNTDVTAQQRHEEQLQLLVHELNHRVKNTLAVVQSVAAQSFREPVELNSARNKFGARLVAMSAAHDLLTQQAWKGAWIGDVLRRALLPFAQDQERIAFKGPQVWITPKMALSLAMAMHELGTNAVKYGALSGPEGTISVNWSLSAQGEPLLRIEWRESGGPRVEPPARRGFGTRLIEQVLAADIDGRVQLLFNPEGVACIIEANIEAPAAGEAPDSIFAA
jgi:PAS domain S-box-containing protein